MKKVMICRICVPMSFAQDCSVVEKEVSNEIYAVSDIFGLDKNIS